MKNGKVPLVLSRTCPTCSAVLNFSTLIIKVCSKLKIFFPFHSLLASSYVLWPTALQISWTFVDFLPFSLSHPYSLAYCYKVDELLLRESMKICCCKNFTTSSSSFFLCHNIVQMGRNEKEIKFMGSNRKKVFNELTRFQFSIFFILFFADKSHALA